MSRRLLIWSIIILVFAAAAVWIIWAVRPQPVAVVVWDMKKISIN